MFLFRSKRSTLTKRLLRARVRGARDRPPLSLPSAPYINPSAAAPASPPASLLKRLKQPQLEQLLAAVESRGADPSQGACVLLPRESAVPAGAEPHVLSCQVWRWPEIRGPAELRCLPGCASASADKPAALYVCCNPYHWSRLCKPEHPPPPYTRIADHRRDPQERAPSETVLDNEDAQDDNETVLTSQSSPRTVPRSIEGFDRDILGELDTPTPADERWQGSLTTSGEGGSQHTEWCHLAYWELASRVGRLFPVRRPAVSVSAGAAEPAGEGLCLATLATAAASPPPPPTTAVLRTRSKIGLGVTLSREGDGVWAYNRSDAPIFINSPALDDPDSQTLLVYRVPPGHCLNVFRSDTPETHWVRWGAARAVEGRVDPHAVRISFVKGWGPKYSRQQLTSCPCWLEVFLRPR